MNLLSIPDIVGMLILMGVLWKLRARHRDDSVDLWFLGLFFILVEEVAVSVYRGAPLLHATWHMAALDAYLLAGVTFGWAARRDFVPGSQHVPLFLLPAIPLFALTTVYGLGLKDPRPYVYLCVLSLIVGIVYISIWASKSLAVRTVVMLVHFAMWLPMLWFAQRGSLRAVVYWGLACLYLLVAHAFRGRIRRGQMGGVVIVASFAIWAICFSLHPWVRSRVPWDGIVEQVWDLQKFFVILGMILSMLESESDLRRAEAMHDALTGLPNRRLFDDRLSQSLERCLRSGKSTALFNVDLDSFKQVNDTLGHSAGDMVLRRVAEELQGVVRSSDTLARCGGDEFCIVVNDLARRTDCERIAQSLRAAVEQVTLPSGLPLSASIGYAMFPDDAADSEELYRLADRRMYEHKRGEVSITPARRQREAISTITERRAR